jgi:hypothetical protein
MKIFTHFKKERFVQAERLFTFRSSLSTKILIFICCLCVSNTLKATIKTFNVASGNWETITAWLPTGSAPANGDTVIIPAGRICFIVNAATGAQTFAALTVNGQLNVHNVLQVMPNITADTIWGTGRIQVVNENPIPLGKVWKPTIHFASTTVVQNIPYGTYDSLALDGQKSKKFVGRIRVKGFSINNSMTDVEKFITTGSCIEFIGTSSTTIPSTASFTQGSALVYDSLIINDGGSKTVVNGTFSVRKYLYIHSAAAMIITGTTALRDSSASGTGLVIAGTGAIRLTSTSSTSLPANRTWIQPVIYFGTGSQTIVSGTYDYLNGTGTGGRILSSTGDIVISGQFIQGTSVYTVGTSTVKYIGTDTQTVGQGQYYNLILSNGHKIFPTSGSVKIQGAFTPGSVTVTTTNSTIDFNGAVQNIPSFSYGNLYTTLAAGDNTKTATGNLVISDTLKITYRLYMSTFKLSGTFVVSPLGSGSLFTANTSSSPIPSGKMWMGTVTYNSTGTQTIVAGDYETLDHGSTPTNRRIFSSSDTIRIRNTLFGITATNDFVTTGSTIAYTSTANQNVKTLVYHNLIIGGSGIKSLSQDSLTVHGTLNVTSTLDLATRPMCGLLTAVTGTGIIKTSYTGSSVPAFPISRNWPVEVQYYSPTGTQRVSEGNYTNLTFIGPSRKVFLSSDTIGISGAFIIPSSGTYGITGSTVNFNGKDQSIPSFTFNNLIISGTGTKTVAGSIIAAAIQVESTLDLGIYTLSGITAQSGKGWIETQIASTAGAPVPTRAWTCGIELNGEYDQIIPAGGPFGKLKLSGSGIKAAQDNFSVSDSLIVNSQLELGTYTLSTGGTLKTHGKGLVRIANTSNTPIPAAITWSPQMHYYANSGVQNIMGGIYSDLRISSSVLVDAQKRMSGSVTVNDSLILDVSTVLNVKSNTLTVNGYLYYEDIISNRIFTDEYSSVVIGGNTGDNAGDLNLSIVEDGYRSVGNFTLNRPGGSVSLGNGKMGVHGTLNVQNGILHTNDNLVLVSNSSGTANTGPLLSGADITGVVAVQRYIPPVTRRWRFISSPVSGSTLTTLQNSMYVTGTGNAANGFDSTLSSIASVFSYNETVTTGDYNTGWVAASNINNSVTTGTGYRVFIRGDRSDPGRLNGTVTTQNEVTINWQGPLNKGNISMPVTFTSSGNASNDGWNFVGNPYASPYNWNAFYDAGTNFTNLSSIVYVLDASCYCYKSYNASSNAGTLTNGIIPAGAGFWVKATAASPTLTLTEQFKTSTSPINTIFKTTSEETFTIRLIADSISYDEVLIKYLDGSQRTKDSFDIQKLAASVINIGTYGSDNEPLSLSSRPPVTTNDTIRLKVQSGTSGTFTMQFMNSTVQDQVYLFDTYTSQVINLKTTNQYTFTITTTIPSSQGLNRFYIVVSNSTSLPVELLSFTAKKTSAKQVQLNWITGLELNNDRFEIERSADNETFEKLSEINGRGNTTSVSSYQYIDKTPQELNYYRLKQTDKDGKFTYSQTRVINMRITSIESMSVTVYPNPVANTLTIETQDNAFSGYRLFNETGRLILSKSLNQSRESIRMDQLATGTYYLEITDQNHCSAIERIVKQ